MKKLHGVLACALAVGCGDDGAENMGDSGSSLPVPVCEIEGCRDGFSCTHDGRCAYTGLDCEAPFPMRRVLVPIGATGLLATSDLDADGWEDLVAPRIDGFVIMFNRQGAFAADALLATPLQADASLVAMHSGDFDGDGFGDVVLLGELADGGTRVSFITGGVEAGPATTTSDLRLSGRRVYVGDLDEDGDSDLIGFGELGEMIGYLSSGSFCGFTPFDPPVDTTIIGLDDVDGDGDLDLIGQVFEGLTISHGEFGATFSAAVIVSPASGNVVLTLAGTRPFGFATWSGGEPSYGVRFERWTGQEFEDDSDHSLRLVRNLAPGDFDGDGSLDVAVSGDREILLRLASQQTDCEWRFPGGYLVHTVPDLDGDGRPDVISPTQEGLVVLLSSG